MTAGRFLFILVLTVIVNGLLILRVSGWGLLSEPVRHQGRLPLRNGDLVLRCSKGLVSDWFRITSLTDRRFSHAGIFLQTSNGPAVAHVSQDLPSGLKLEPLDRFCSSYASDLVGWARTDLTDIERKKLHSLILKELSSGREFDDRFSLDESRKHYCTEWVREVFISITGDSSYFPVTEVDEFRYVAPDNLYLNTHSSLVRTFEP